ncbi:DUF3376 domain-containing protein [Salinibacterium sp. G-O1]|uniref:DUF3376 domain-containing protein n=1 Tax=Salinibacterium sp. G-O1 TaxID=3046208 RepID=UPI0024B9E04E|nr:DUF3376 domain-containing protein [Salinibacterium sp. G-O1]MDJ0333875.1 DUF3376 domain-containing protein [Salinibacterium sp. G-O1]
MQPSIASLIPLNIAGDAPPPDSRKPAFNRSLRVALAMKGGISLAVWIGGAVAELDLLRRVRVLGAPEHPAAYLVHLGVDESDEVIARARIYADLMIGAKFDQVEFDVLAGASAGGLNAVLFGVSQRAGVSFDTVLRTWLDAGAVWNLLRKPWAKKYTSLLDGDHYFAGQARRAINELLEAPASEDHQARAVSVELSGTVVDADAQPEWGFQEGRAHFRFTGSQSPAHESTVPGAPISPAGREIPSGDAPNDVAFDRLAYAARTTSSFPGAFEPARILSRPVGGLERIDPSTPHIDFDFAFSHHRAQANRAEVEAGRMRPFRVIDGGVADNVPIDRALRSVQRMPAEDFVSRSILYLEPDPTKLLVRDPTPSALVPPSPEAPPPPKIIRMIDNIRNAMSLRGVRESGDEEINQLERFRRERILWQGRRESFASLGVSYDAKKARPGYARYRSTADLSLLSDALTDPAVWQLGTDLPTRTAVPPASRELIVALETQIFKCYDPDRVETSALDNEQIAAAILLGPQAVLDAAACAIAWLRELESNLFDRDQWFSEESERQRIDARRRVNDIAAAVRANRDLALNAALISTCIDDHLGAVGAARLVVATWIDGNHDWNGDIYWSELGKAVALIKQLSDRLPEAMTRDVPWTVFAAIDGAEAIDLAPFTAVIGIPTPVSSLRFDVISANERCSLDEDFRSLQLAQSVDLAEQWMHLDDDELFAARTHFDDARDIDAAGHRRLQPFTKLAGTTLWSFGAFFSSWWRTNDWWWGRLDGAAGVVRILGDHASADATSAAADARAAQSSILSQAARSDERERPFVGDCNDVDPIAVAGRMSAGAHSLRNLSDGYLVAVASRAARAALRAARTGRGTIARLAITAFLPPLLVNLPFVVAPARAALLALVVAAVVAILASGPATLQPYPEFGFVVGVAGLVIVAIVLSAALVRGAIELHQLDRRRPAVIREVTAPHDQLGGELRGLLDTRGASSRSWSWGMWIGSVAFFAAAIIATIVYRGAQPVAVCLTLLAVASLIASLRKARRLDMPRPDGSTRRWLLAGIAPTVVIVFSHLIAEATSGWARELLVPLLVAAVGLVAAFVLTQGWLPARRSAREQGVQESRGVLWWLLTLFATAAAAGLAAWLVMVSFQGSSLLAQPAAAGLFAWFLGAHVFWWLSERASGDSALDADDTPID